jgi:ParB-like chromosome segregation protein Spo0J
VKNNLFDEEAISPISIKTIEASIGKISKMLLKLKTKNIDAQIKIINSIKMELHKISPLKNEPVDCVIWENNENIMANDYNPNAVAPPEMELLRLSISEDGYTQPIVTFNNENKYEVVDGFHRNRVGKECPDITKRLHGYLPIVIINQDRIDKGDRIASTIRHNRARGKHKIDAMSEIILDLRKRNWNDKKIAKELGMEMDEVLRLAQITGLAEMFKDQEFSQAWEADTSFENNIEGEE